MSNRSVKAQATLTGYAGYPALDCPKHSVASLLHAKNSLDVEIEK